MSGPIFVWDAQGTALMPMAAAHARKLLQSGKVVFQPHHAFTIVRLTQTVAKPVLRPIVLSIAIHLHRAELYLLAEGEHDVFPLLHVIVDLHTDMQRRLRRRAGHRRRRRARGPYRAPRRYGLPYKLRRPSRAQSAWTSRAYRAENSPPRLQRLQHSPTMNWRAEAIERVINTLRNLVPISHVLIHEPLRGQPAHIAASDQGQLREHLIASSGATNAAGERIARCAYCGTTTGQIEIDHIVPASRGGTDRWSNRVLACAACNARKGNRSAEEAGMSLRWPPNSESSSPARSRPYCRRTARLLRDRLDASGLRIVWKWSDNDQRAELSPAMTAALASFIADPAPRRCSFIAKPIARTRKQIFSARNYPLSTPSGPGFTRVGQTVKRRIQVNKALARWKEGKQVITRVISASDPIPDQAEQVIRIGMLCEGQRAGRKVTGIVNAIHSDNRLTLLVPQPPRGQRIAWRRIVIGVQRHLRILSSDGIVFFPVPVRDWEEGL